MTDDFSDVVSEAILSQSKAEHVKHSYSYGFRVLTRLSDKGDVLCVLKTHPSWENTHVGLGMQISFRYRRQIATLVFCDDLCTE